MKNLTNLLKLSRLMALAVGLTLTVTSSVARESRSDRNLVQQLERDGRFNTLLAALDIAGLKDTVATGGVFTVFAPTDQAFGALPPGTLDSLVTNVPALQKILLYHVLDGKESLRELVGNSTATTLQGNPVLALTEGYKVLINGQRVSYRSITANNGIIHPIEGVLLPPDTDININSLVDVLALDGRFNTLITAVVTAGLGDTLTTGGPFTLFAPTDAAFAALPPGTVESLLGDIPALQDILTYHVLGEPKSALSLLFQKEAMTLQGEDVSITYKSGGVFINQASLVNPNVKAPNGIIHVIDAVLLPPPPAKNLLETLRDDGRFTTLITALEVAALDTVIAEGGTFTLFAPTDEAFAQVPSATLNSLLSNPEALAQVLLYHVVSGDQSAKDLLQQRRVPTLQGDNVVVYNWWKRVFVNRSEVIDADIGASNGRVHAINGVLLPPAR